MSPTLSDGPPGSPPVQPQQVIILPGFARQEQLEIDYGSLLFRSTWTSKCHTDAAWAERFVPSHYLLKAVHYGNNMALLFKACINLNRYYESPHFWTAVARGFSCKGPFLQAQVDTLVRARKAYLRNYGNCFKSHAVKAVDTWINIVASKQPFHDHRPESSLDERRLFEASERYYADAKMPRFLHTDAAGVLSRLNDPDMSHRPRKRSRSSAADAYDDEPCSAGPKRRPRPGDGHHPLDSSYTDRSAWDGLPPLKTEFRDADLRTRHSPASNPTAHDTHSDEPIGRIRGCASHESLSSKPVAAVLDPVTQPSPKDHNLERANELLRDRIDLLGKKLETQQKTDVKAAVAEQNAEIARHALEMLNRFEKRLLEVEAQRARDAENAQTRIDALEAKLAAQQTEATTSNALLARIASLEEKLSGMNLLPFFSRVRFLEDQINQATEQASGARTNAVAAEEALNDLSQRLAQMESKTEQTTERIDKTCKEMRDETSELSYALSKYIVTTGEDAAKQESTMRDHVKEVLEEAIDTLPAMRTLSNRTIHVEKALKSQKVAADRLNKALEENQEMRTRWKKLNSLFADMTTESAQRDRSLGSLQDQVTALADRLDQIAHAQSQVGDAAFLSRRIEEVMARTAGFGDEIKVLRTSQEDTALRIAELVDLLHNSFAS
ncbi:hypothetical protein BD289DRAFT_455799 [Coniella lustricola]|uniref:Uncharacterized protein n=1 Tax=Coniella lustricola TaxID=2025994 RepID=A0A2T2ZYE6_9PEZI|nr:hypothetical protein BD289DRAFT_455799 [Coniella lustricola]